MKILAIEHELLAATTEQFHQYAVDEARRVWELTQADIIREAYFRVDLNEAILVLECISLKQAEEMLSTLPFVQNKLIHFELIPLRAYPGFERLFARD